MTRFRHGLILLAIAAGAISPSRAQTSVLKTTDRKGASIDIASPFEHAPAYGFTPLQIKLENPGLATAKWSINQSTYGSSGFHGEFTLECPSQETRALTVMVPVGDATVDMYSYSQGCALLITGEGVRESRGFGNNYQSKDSNVLIGVRSNLAPKVPNPVNFDTSMAPVDWRAYQGYAGVVISDEEWHGLAPGARLALLTWVKSGGALAVVGQDVPPGRDGFGLPAVLPGQDPIACGLGNLYLIAKKEFQGMGYVLTGQHADAFRRRDSSASASTDAWQNRAPALFRSANTPLVNGLMLLVVVAFAVVIGPINLFLIAPSKRRHRLFFSVPIISASAGALLLLGVVIGDGFGGKGTRHVLVENQPGDGGNNNHVIQYQTSRCGVLFSTGFTSKGAVFIEQLAAPGRSSRGEYSSGSYGLKINETELVASGPWFSSRTSQHYRMAAVTPTRGRIEASGDGEATKLTSSFDFPITSLLFSRDGRKWYQADGLRQGEPVGVKEVAEAVVARAVADQVKEAPREIADRADTLRRRPRHFIAFTAAPPAIDTHSAIRWTDHGIITGPLVIP